MSRCWPFAVAALAAVLALAAVAMVPPPWSGAAGGPAVEAADLARSFSGGYDDPASGARFTVTLEIIDIRTVDAGSDEAAPFGRAAPNMGGGLFFTGRHLLTGDPFPQPVSHPVVGLVDPVTRRAAIIPVTLQDAAGDRYPGAFVGTLARNLRAIDLGWIEPDGSNGGRLLLEAP